MAEGFRVTYATMSADNEQMHADYDKGIEQAKAELGEKHPFYVNGEELEQHNGFTTPMQPLGAAGEYTDVMRPYGVWGVISPFNFPLALAAGPTGAALVAGNTVVFKPSNAGAMLGIKLYEVYRDAGVPPAAFHCVTGGGGSVGAEIVENRDVAGLTFTGSYEVGMGIYKSFAKDYP